MKKTIRLLFLVLTVAVFTGCQNDINDLIDDTSQTSAQFEKDMQMIAKLGFSTENVIDRGDYYLVEGDIAIMKSESYEVEESVDSSDTPSLRQARFDYIISVNNVADLKIMINPALGDSWRKAITAAIQHYNNILSNIQIREVTSAPDVTIQYGNISAWGQGTPPTSDGKAGKTVFIQNSTAANSLSHAQKVFLVVHELGHNLGMRHTDHQTTAGEGAAINIPGTPGADLFSVFNSGYHYGGQVATWNSFSQYDIKAIQTLYPIRISKSASSTGIGERVTFTIDNSKASIANIQWIAASGLKLVSGQSSKSAVFEITANGYVSAQAYIQSGMNYYPTGTSGTAERVTASSTASIWSGAPMSPDLSGVPLQLYAGTYREISLANAQPGTTYKWNITGVSDIYESDNHVSFRVNQFYYDGAVSITVVAKNKYGESTTRKSIPVKGLGGGNTGGDKPGLVYPEI